MKLQLCPKQLYNCVQSYEMVRMHILFITEETTALASVEVNMKQVQHLR